MALAMMPVFCDHRHATVCAVAHETRVNLKKAVVMPRRGCGLYEEDFLGFSYGFRGQHDALDALHAGILRKQVNWVLDADIRGFLDVASYYTSGFFERVEEVRSNRRHLNSYAFCPSAIDVNSLEFAALYTLQDSLSRDTE